MKQEMMGRQWHRLDHTRIICTSLQTDNHASNSSLNLYRPDALPDAQPKVSNPWRPYIVTLNTMTRPTAVLSPSLSSHGDVEHYDPSHRRAVPLSQFTW